MKFIAELKHQLSNDIAEACDHYEARHNLVSMHRQMDIHELTNVTKPSDLTFAEIVRQIEATCQNMSTGFLGHSQLRTSIQAILTKTMYAKLNILKLLNNSIDLILDELKNRGVIDLPTDPRIEKIVQYVKTVENALTSYEKQFSSFTDIPAHRQADLQNLMTLLYEDQPFWQRHQCLLKRASQIKTGFLGRSRLRQLLSNGFVSQACRLDNWVTAHEQYLKHLKMRLNQEELLHPSESKPASQCEIFTTNQSSTAITFFGRHRDSVESPFAISLAPHFDIDEGDNSTVDFPLLNLSANKGD
jgi:hypothetical protein